MFKGLNISLLFSIVMFALSAFSQVSNSEKAETQKIISDEETKKKAKKQSDDDDTVVSVDKEIEISTVVEKEVGHESYFAIEIEYENIQTRKKYVTAYSVEVEIKTPSKFEVHLTPYKRQILGGGIPDPELRNAIVIGKSEIKRSGELFNISVFALGAEFSREYEILSPRLRLILEMGLHTLGYRYFQRGKELGNYTGFEIIGAYPGARVEYDLTRKYTLAFSVENETKVSATRFQKPLIENTLASKFYVKPKFENGFLKHLDSVWYKNKRRNNSPGTFESEKAHEVGMTWSFGRSQHIEPVERCTLTAEEKAAGWKCINP